MQVHSQHPERELADQNGFSRMTGTLMQSAEAQDHVPLSSSASLPPASSVLQGGNGVTSSALPSVLQSVPYGNLPVDYRPAEAHHGPHTFHGTYEQPTASNSNFFPGTSLQGAFAPPGQETNAFFGPPLLPTMPGRDGPGPPGIAGMPPNQVCTCFRVPPTCSHSFAGNLLGYASAVSHSTA